MCPFDLTAVTRLKIKKRLPLRIVLLAATGAMMLGQTAAKRYADDNAMLTDRQMAHHVLSRLAFGPRPGQVDDLIEVGWENWVKKQLDPQSLDDDQTDAVQHDSWPSLAMSMTDIFTTYRPPYPTDREPTPEEEEIRYNLRHKLKRELVESVLHRAIHSNRQFQEVIVEFWRNHFNIFQDKSDVQFLANHYEVNVLRRHAFGKFGNMLMASARHPAMLIYLDNVVSQKPLTPIEQRLVARYEGRKRQPASVIARARHRGLNENYARELMELHTLGVDNYYSQFDVIEVARVLTGWSAGWSHGAEGQGEYGFIFRPHVHDERKKIVLGSRIPGRGVEEGERLVRSLAKHRGTAKFISWKLCRFLVSDEPSERLVNQVAQVFRRSGGNLPKVYEAIIFSRDFLSRDNYRSKFKSPFELVVSALRVVDAKIENFDAIIHTLRMMGQPIYGCVDPPGYGDQAEAWLDPGVMVYRWDFALRLANGRIGGVSIPQSVIDSVSELSLDERTETLIKLIVPDELDTPTQSLLNDAIKRQVATRPMMGVAIGSPMFQQQ